MDHEQFQVTWDHVRAINDYFEEQKFNDLCDFTVFDCHALCGIFKILLTLFSESLGKYHLVDEPGTKNENGSVEDETVEQILQLAYGVD